MENDNNNNEVHNAGDDDNQNHNAGGNRVHDIVLPREVQDFIDNLGPRVPVYSMDEVPPAPVKANGFWSRRPHHGLPRPFEFKPSARRALFREFIPQSPLPPVPQCPARKPVYRAASFLDRNLDSVVRRKLNFDQAAERPSRRQISHQSPSGAYNITDSPSVNAPRKRKYPEAEVHDKMEVGNVDLGDDDCPAPPANSPATPANHAFDEDDHERWAWISTPKSAPLPTYTDSPIVPITRRRSDGGTCYGRKRLSF